MDATNLGPQAEPASSFEPYREHRYTGMVGRFFATGVQLLALAFGGGFAYVRSKQAEGEGWLLEIVLLRILLLFAWPFLDKKVISQPFPIQFRIRLERLGPTYIKLGQILSLREDILPTAITDELKNLLERSPAIDFDRFKQLVEADLGRPLKTMFRWIDSKPLGSASLAQTHRARLITHEKAVIKLLKPGVRKLIITDTRLMRIFGWVLQLFAGRFQPRQLIDEFSKYTLREVDLHNEADHAETFAANFKDNTQIRFPKIYRDFSTRDVLVMEYFRGIRPDSAGVKRLTQQQRNQAIDLGISAIIQMIFQDGFFHADLHPGNMVLFANGTIGFIDLGMVGRFDRDRRKRLFYYFYSLVTGDTDDAARYLTSLALPGRGGDLDGFRRAVADLYGRWLRAPSFYEFSLAQVILRSILLAGRYNVKYPGEIILMVKALITVEGVGNLLVPGIDLVSASRKHVIKLLLQEFNPLRWLRDSALLVPEMVDVLNRSPLILSEGLSLLENNLKKPAPEPISGLRATILAGFCLLSGAVVASLGGPWPVWAILFLLALIFSLRK